MNLPVDFGCVCLYDPASETLTVTRVGVHSETLAMELAMKEEARIPIDQNGLSRCVQGHLVSEPDLSTVDFPFPQRLYRGGLSAVVCSAASGKPCFWSSYRRAPRSPKL